MESGFDLERVIKEHRTTLLLSIVGLFLLGVGVLSTVVISFKRSEPQAEIISSQEVRMVSHRRFWLMLLVRLRSLEFIT
jgi:hypothetical protein